MFAASVTLSIGAHRNLLVSSKDKSKILYQLCTSAAHADEQAGRGKLGKEEAALQNQLLES